MKKLVLFLWFVLFAVGLYAQALTDSTAVISYTFGDSFMEFLTENWIAIAGFALWLISDLIGESKLADNSIYKVVINFLKSMLKKKATKIVAIAAGLFCLGGGLNDIKAQTKWDGFFKPVDQVVAQLPTAKAEGVTTTSFLWRPTVAVTAYALNLQDTKETNSFTSAGVGISYGKFTTVNDEAYCNFSVNGLLMTSVKIGDETETDFGLGITVDVFNKFIGIGGAYVGKDFFLLIPISISF